MKVIVRKLGALAIIAATMPGAQNLAHAANYTLQCDIVETPMITERSGTGKTTFSPDRSFRLTIEFIGNGQAVFKADLADATAHMKNVVTSDTVYIFYDINKDPRTIFDDITIDRLTGKYSGNFEIVIMNDVTSLTSKGTCRPVRVAPKM